MANDKISAVNDLMRIRKHRACKAILHISTKPVRQGHVEAGSRD